MKVECTVEEIELDSDLDSTPIDSVCLTCSRCEQTAEVFGRSARSIRRGLVMLREDCPMGEDNFYVTDGSHDHG